jgi:hypothetical protein
VDRGEGGFGVEGDGRWRRVEGRSHDGLLEW